MEMQSSIPAAEMALFCRQFGTMLSADVNLLPVVATLRQQTSNETLREVLLNVQEELEMGIPLAVAFSRYPQDFSPFFLQLVRQGEIEGALPDVLQRLAAHYDSGARGDIGTAGSQVTVNLDMGTAVEALRPLLTGLLLTLALVAFAVAAVLYATSAEIIPDTHLGPNIVLTVCLTVVLATALVSRFRPRTIRRCAFCDKLDTQVEAIYSSRGVSICNECVVEMVHQMRKPAPAAPTPAPAEPEAAMSAAGAQGSHRRQRADRVAFRDPEELIDLAVELDDEGAMDDEAEDPN